MWCQLAEKIENYFSFLITFFKVRCSISLVMAGWQGVID
jgi:hypothetical protein